MRKISILLVFGFLFIPNLTFAVAVACSKDGYTVITMNGVFTEEDDAKKNKEALELRLDREYKGEKLKVDYLLNATHLAGFGDGLKAFKQKVEEGVPSDDYDLIEMLKEASEKVTTQKLLLVGHSQGNFYANSFYDYVTESGGHAPSVRASVPKESIGVYSVATPSDHVSGDGKYLTSKTDKVIAGLVGSLPFFRIMPPNSEISLKEEDNILGHSFSDIYLKYKPTEIIEGIEWSLDKLTTNNTQLTTCIDPPKITLAHKAVGAMFAVADPVANAGKETLVYSVGVAYQGSVFVVKVGVQTAGAVAALGNFVAETSVAATVWTYKTGVAAAKATGSAIADVTGAAYSAVKSLVGGTGGNNLGLSNTASVALGVPLPKLPAVDSMGQGARDEGTVPQAHGNIGTGANNIGTGTPKTPNGASESQTLESLAKTLALAEAQVAEIKRVIDSQSQKAASASSAKPGTSAESGKSESDDTPKIIFIGPAPGSGGAGFGGGEKPKVLVSSGDSSILTPVVQSSSLSAPTLTVAQCDYSLALDGCLLATTTVNFSWASVAGADYYEINKNGTVATTTDTTFDVVASDFSDYVLSVLAINTATTSSTVSKTVSVATIPIAINEIAWMGTVASTNDEWLELKNNTARTIDLSQWALTAADNTPYVALSGTMAPNEYRVLERRANTITASAVVDTYGNGAAQWALGNGGEKLLLSHASTTLDSTPTISGNTWAGGYNSTTNRKSMERYGSKESGADASNWGTNRGFVKNGTDADGNAIDGTPGARNSVSYLINRGQNVTDDLTLMALDGYFVSTSTTVSASGTLSIEPGVTIKFMQPDSGNAELKVLGELHVLGTSEDAVVFEAFSGTQIGRIRFVGGVGATSTIEFAHLENIRGVTVTDNAKVEISDTQFVENYYGLDIDGASTVSVENSSFASTTKEAIASYENSVVTISSSTIANTLDADAIGIYDGSNVTISSSTIDRVYDGDGVGVYDSTLHIASSTICDIEDGDGVGIYDSTVTITGSTVQDIFDGGGIVASDSTVSISSSTIENISGGGDAIGLYDSNSTIINTTVLNGEDNGIVIDGGTATITGGTVSGFADGAGISVDEPETPVVISGTEVSGNAVGIISDAAASVSIAPSVSVHDNDVNVVVEP
ncbi:MAG: Polymorphic membrane protein [Parcubacteria group bacterium GW2011_GWA2_47_16]|nr:MAG: Polymorphic membrane protein [Parcubacteria group bacterium GW2011_GWA2_47_16]